MKAETTRTENTDAGDESTPVATPVASPAPTPAVSEESSSLLSRFISRWSGNDDLDDVDDGLPRAALAVVWLLASVLIVLGVWAVFAELDEVSTGEGRVIPTSGEQIIQSLEGGLVSEVLVREGDIVEQGQELFRLSTIGRESEMAEVAARYFGGLARVARLEAEVYGTPMVYPEEIRNETALLRSENELYQSRLSGLERSREGLEQELALVREERGITERLVRAGAASEVELLRLRRKEAELQRELDGIESDFRVRAGDDLTRARTEVEALQSQLRGRQDSFQRTTLRAPVRGIIQNIEVSTVGGVVAPNGKVLEIVPLGEELLIETRISPRDIAFIRPDLEAKIKLTAYDSAIYGGLDGRVVNISPDTFRDEVDPQQIYYRVNILADSSVLINQAGREFPITPGMIATVDIKTGQKTVFEYLIKPLNRAREALRER